jgi:hypothetical protein
MTIEPLLLADLAENIGNSVVNILAVAGGAAIGYFAVWGIVWGGCRAVIHKTPPKTVQKLLNVCGAIVGGLIVFALLFKGNGTGWGSGSGWNLFGGSGKGSSQTNSTASTTRTQNTTPTVPIVKDNKSSNAVVLQIRVLGGKNVQQKRYYVVEQEATAYTLQDLEPIIRERMQAKSGRLAINSVEIVLDPNQDVDWGHEAVVKLEKFARGEGLTVNTPKKPEQ